MICVITVLNVEDASKQRCNNQPNSVTCVSGAL